MENLLKYLKIDRSDSFLNWERFFRYRQSLLNLDDWRSYVDFVKESVEERSIIKNMDASISVFLMQSQELDEKIRQKREMQLMLGYEASKEGILDWNLETDLAYLSRKLCEQIGLGFEYQDSSIDVWLERIHPEDRSRVYSKLFLVKERSLPEFKIKYRIKNPKGEYSWMAFTAKFFPKNPKIRNFYDRIMGSQIDISNEKLLLDKTHEMYKLFELVFHSMSVGLVLFEIQNEEVRVSLTNKSIQRWIFKFAPSSKRHLVKGKIFKSLKLFNQFLSKNDWEIFAELFSISLHEKRDVRTSVFFPIEGKLHYYNVSFTYYYDATSEKEYILYSGEDITNRVNDRLKIKQYSQEYKGFFELANDAMILLDMETQKIIMANQAASKLYQMPLEKLVGAWMLDFVCDLEFGRRQIALLKHKDDTHHFQSKHCPFQSNKVMHVDVRASVVTFEGKNAIMVIIRNISEQINYENQILREKYRAEESENLKSAILANMSHEVRTPLNGIIGISQILSEECDDENAKTYLDMLNISSMRLLNTITNILEYSSLETKGIDVEIKTKPANVLKSLFHNYEILAKTKNLQIKYEIDENVENYEIYIEEFVIDQLLNNLIGNAIKFTMAGSIVVYLKLLESEGVNCFFIGVKDSGIGISEDFVKKMFNPFEQESIGQKRSFQGSGLGLSIVKKYIELYNGTIKVESKKGEGSFFKIYFPILEYNEECKNFVIGG